MRILRVFLCWCLAQEAREHQQAMDRAAERSAALALSLNQAEG